MRMGIPIGEPPGIEPERLNPGPSHERSIQGAVRSALHAFAARRDALVKEYAAQCRAVAGDEAERRFRDAVRRV